MYMPHWPLVPFNQSNKFDLSNIIKLLDALDNPEIKTPPIIHIAGTNGKGSTVAMLRSIFSAAGFKVHTYTSPHLVHFNERIILNNEMISDEYLFDVCERVRIICEKINLEQRFFEATTAAAFLAFSEVKADILILETGLGGRLDATNVITPILSIITPISYDHMEYLGNTLPDIANEKAGIIKTKVPCVISMQTQEVYDTIFKKCDELEAPIFAFGYDFTVERFDNNKFNYITNNTSYPFPNPSLIGEHQFINAAAVIASVTLLNNKFNINTSQIAQGLQNTKWAGRIEKINQNRYSHLVSNNIQIWLDGAHNTHGMQVLTQWMNSLSGDIYLIIGITKNRNIQQLCYYFKSVSNIKLGYAVNVLSEPLSYKAQTLSIEASKIGINFLDAENVKDAIIAIDKTVDKNKENHIVICGSLFLIADFMKI